ncbi:MAG: CPBP family intramembrane metalloprotease [Trueperaceae bacterium]|nr:CPBP family intramembrane metalloprotease [Trueperaceae bacterium]
MRRYIIFLPSALLGLIAGIWLYFKPFPYEQQGNGLVLLLVAGALVGGLLGTAHLLEKYVPSFSYASKLLERSLAQFKISYLLAFSLAAISALAEELFFRAVLMPLIGVWAQAILFGLMHPAPKKAWAYTVFTGCAGLAFGYATLLTGSLVPAIAAHFFINLQGFLELKRLQLKR